MNYMIQLASNVTLTEMDGQTVLFSKETGDFFGLNSTAKYFVEGLIRKDFEKTVAQAVNDFGVDPAIIRRDINDVVSSLEESSLVTKTIL